MKMHTEKYNLIVLVAIVAGILVLNGCDGERFLMDRRQSSTFGPGEGNWQSISDLEGLVSGTYWMTSGEVPATQNQWLARRFVDDLAGDMLVAFADMGPGHTINHPREAEMIYGRNPNDPDNPRLRDVWASSYAAINNANRGISFIEDGLPFDDPDNLATRLEGEFRFLRAFNYHILARFFAPAYSQGTLSEPSVVIRTRAIDTFEDASVGLGTVEEVYDLIVSDLERAIELLPDAPRPQDPEAYNYSRVVRPAAKAMLARVLFEMQRWDEAHALATDVINDGRFTLDEDPIEAFIVDEFHRPNEVIWYYQFVEGDGVGHTSDWKWFGGFNSWNARRADWGNVGTMENPQKYIAAAYSWLEDIGWIDNAVDRNETQEALNDLRYQQLFHRWEAGEDPVFPAIDRPIVWGNKYFRSEGNPPRTNYPMFRVAEMYLTRAIISYRGENGASQDLDQALSDVNMIRQRAGLPSLTQGELTEEIIHQERMKEMAFEGDRVRYLRALRQDIPDGDRGEGSIPWDSDVFVYPIPTNETDFNDAL